jgi:hypothetical protein
MLRAYRLVYEFSSFGPPQLWEWQQRYINHLVLNARTFNRRVVGWWFDNWDALDEDNTRLWLTYYEPKALSELYTGWQEMLAEHRQVVAEVLEIAEETGWRGPEGPVRVEWERRGRSVL